MAESFTLEGIVRLFRSRPSLAPEVLVDALGVPLPAYDEPRISGADLTQLVPVRRTADLVVLLVRGKPVHGIVVEVQLRRDSRKRWTWPNYLTAVRAHLRAPVVLLVVCVDPKVARWASRSFDLGAGLSTVNACVLGPSAVPVVTDPELAGRAPELAVLSAMAHGRGDRAVEVGGPPLGRCRGGRSARR